MKENMVSRMGAHKDLSKVVMEGSDVSKGWEAAMYRSICGVIL